MGLFLMGGGGVISRRKEMFLVRWGCYPNGEGVCFPESWRGRGWLFLRGVGWFGIAAARLTSHQMSVCAPSPITETSTCLGFNERDHFSGLCVIVDSIRSFYCRPRLCLSGFYVEIWRGCKWDILFP